MKILRILLIIIGILILAFLVLALFAPNEFETERSTLIDAPRSTVFSSVNNLDKWKHWDPWSAMDTAATYEYSDTISGTGAWYSWEGEAIGSGKLTIEESNPFEEIDLFLDFGEMGTAESAFTFSDSSDLTKVSWDFHTEEGFPYNVFLWLGGMEETIGASYDQGLQNLKNHVEDLVTAKYNGYEISYTNYPGHIFIGQRQSVSMNRIADFFNSSFAHTLIAINKRDLKMDGNPAGLYFTWDEEEQTTDVMAAIPLQSRPVSLPDTSLNVYEVPKSKALLINYRGAYEAMEPAFEGMEKYVEKTGLPVKEPVIEEYVTDPGMVKDTAEWQTDIYYLLSDGK